MDSRSGSRPLRLAAGAVVLMMATTLGAAERGSKKAEAGYLPAAAGAPVGPTAGTCVTSNILCNSVTQSSLVSTDCTDDAATRVGSYVKKFDFSVNAGDDIEIIMEAENENQLDTYLKLASGATVVAENDDDAEDLTTTNSRIRFRATTTGVHTIWASSYDAGETGNFTLTLRCGAAAQPAQVFRTLTPCRVHDTRGGSGGKMTSLETRRFPMAGGQCGVPSTARAVSINVTVTDNSTGYLSMWPAGGGNPGVSTINFQAGGQYALANAAIVPLGQNGAIDIFSFGDTHVIIDVNGYFDAQ